MAEVVYWCCLPVGPELLPPVPVFYPRLLVSWWFLLTWIRLATPPDSLAVWSMLVRSEVKKLEEDVLF